MILVFLNMIFSEEDFFRWKIMDISGRLELLKQLLLMNRQLSGIFGSSGNLVYFLNIY